jgi:hypothetical protein
MLCSVKLNVCLNITLTADGLLSWPGGMTTSDRNDDTLPLDEDAIGSLKAGDPALTRTMPPPERPYRLRQRVERIRPADDVNGLVLVEPPRLILRRRRI